MTAALPFLLALALAAPVDEAPLTIEAAQIEFLEAEQRIEATGHVRVTYGADRLTADRISADLETEEVTAEGNVTFTRENQIVHGDRVVYNWERRQGRAEAARTQFRGVLITAGELISQEDRAEALHSRFTTCELKRPHYYLSARQIVIYPGRRVVVYRSSLYFLGSRLLTVPRFSRSLRRDEEGPSLLPTVSINSRDTLLLRRELTVVDREALILDLDLGLSLRRGFVGGAEATGPGKPAWIAAVGVKQESPNQRTRFLSIDRLPEVGLVISSAREVRRPRRVPYAVQHVRLLGDDDGDPSWEWGAEATAGFYRQRPDPRRRDPGLDRQEGRLDVRAVLSRRNPRIGPVRLSFVRVLARTSFYGTGDWFTVAGIGAGAHLKASPNLRLWLARYVQVTDGATPFRFDEPDLLREWRPGALLTLRGTSLSWEGRYDSSRGRFFDQEFAVSHVFHCLRPKISYRTRRAQIGFDLQIVALDNNRNGGDPRSSPAR